MIVFVGWWCCCWCRGTSASGSWLWRHSWTLWERWLSSLYATKSEWTHTHKGKKKVKERTQKRKFCLVLVIKKHRGGFKPVLRWLLKPLLADEIRRGSRSAGSRQKISDHIPAESHPVQTPTCWDDAPVLTTAWRHDLNLLQIKIAQMFPSLTINIVCK